LRFGSRPAGRPRIPVDVQTDPGGAECSVVRTDSEPSTPLQQRASDADRDRAIEVLNNAVAIGQLTPDEHGARIQSALEAVTVADLAGLTKDVEGPPRTKRRPQVRGRVVIACVLAAGLAAVLTAVGHSGSVRPGGSAGQGTSTPATLPPALVVASRPSDVVGGISIAVVRPGPFASHDPADYCGPFGTEYPGGGENCYLVVEFTNRSTAPVGVVPGDIKMVDQTGDTYRVSPVEPRCYDSVDVNESQVLPPKRSLTVQLCYPVMTGALPSRMEGSGLLEGLSLRVPPDSVVGTWGGD